MYDLANFTQDNARHCAIKLRNLDERSQSMEETANRMVRYLYENLIDPQKGEKACTLIRFFKTHPYRGLSEDLQQAAQAVLKDRAIIPATKCLTLLATVGDESFWNARQESTGHQAIPLIDRDFVYRAPMILQLIQQFGLEVNAVVDTAPTLIAKKSHKPFNVFHVAEAVGSPYIPAQEQFVLPYRVQSVLGFGGMLSSGNLFAVILFSKVPISLTVAGHFKWISAYVRIAVDLFDQGNVFAEDARLLSKAR
jgi:hypothetical protein